MKLSELCPVELPTSNLTKDIFIGHGVSKDILEIAEGYLGSRPIVVSDPHTFAASGFEQTPSQSFDLPRHPHADDSTVAMVHAALRDRSGALAIGSGTVNDLVKRASHLNETPYIVMGTAASMNGYASGIAAILSNGLKTTVPARPPRAIILDTKVLAAAPPRLTQAGLGDLISKPVSDSDWWLAHQIEGSGYSNLPSQIVDHAVNEAIRSAPGLAQGDPEAHGALGAALVLSGVAMVVAGSSSPASGGEHLISHLWDMENLSQGRETRLHGAQVGVATCISAALYHTILATKTPQFPTPEPWEDVEARICAEHGRLAEVILHQAKQKHARAAERVAVLRDRWPSIRDGLAERKIPRPETIRHALSMAGAPNTLSGLGESRSNAARVFRLARDIRDRVTVLDLGFELGILPNRIDDILDLAGV